MIGHQQNTALGSDLFEVFETNKLNPRPDKYRDKHSHKGKAPETTQGLKVANYNVWYAKSQSLSKGEQSKLLFCRAWNHNNLKEIMRLILIAQK